MRIALVIGTRPQFIKLAPFIKAAKGKLDLLLIDTGQHYDAEMSGAFVREFKLPSPDHHLNVGSCSHGLQTGRMLGRLDAVLSQERPDMTVVFGDTNSTLAGALASVKLEIPVGHIEAGTRSNDLAMPEEVNRRVVDAISTLLFAPTKNTAKNLRAEGHSRGIYEVGDIMVDTLEHSLRMAKEHSTILEDSNLEDEKYIFATVHRPSNTDDKSRLKTIIGAMGELDMPIIMPIHPRTLKRMKEFRLGNDIPANLNIVDPVSHHDSVQLINHAYCAMTDSGGVAKEAYLLKTPCVTLRTSTEWPETVTSGYNTLVEIDRAAIIKAVNGCRTGRKRTHLDYFGLPGVSERIVSIIRSWKSEVDTDAAQ
ncbi:MAG: UDP-N-acetylglucosamine 2-epimerase (non-hydrolyzing) [Thermoplasmata archaeon]